MRISAENRKEIEPFFAAAAAAAFAFQQAAQVENHTRKLMMMERLV